MKSKNDKTRTLDQFKDKHYGKIGTVKRDELDSGYEDFKIESKKILCLNSTEINIY